MATGALLLLFLISAASGSDFTAPGGPSIEADTGTVLQRIQSKLRGESGQALSKRMLERIAAMDRRIDELRPKVDSAVLDLRALRGGYDSVSDLKRLDKRRGLLRAALVEHMREINRLGGEYQRITREFALDVMAEVAAGLRKGRMEGGISDRINDGLRVDRARMDLAGLNGIIETELSSDQAAYEVALKMAAFRRRSRLMAQAGCAAVLLGGAVALWRRGGGRLFGPAGRRPGAESWGPGMVLRGNYDV